MFDKQYRFKGRHALRVDQLTGVFDELSKAKLIDRNVDVYTNAPLIGFLYGRTADLDDLKNPETGQIYNQNVMGDRVIYSGDELQYNFWLIMLLDANYEPDEEAVLDVIIPKYVTSLIYGGITESAASENGARMQAMDSASKNAEEMMEKLQQQYNRARQGAITQELTEIIAGAEAVD